MPSRPNLLDIGTAVADGASGGGFDEPELDTLRARGGYSPPKFINDAEFLGAFGFQGTTVPDYFKDMAKWFMDGTLDRQDLMHALTCLEGRGLLPG